MTKHTPEPWLMAAPPSTGEHTEMVDQACNEIATFKRPADLKRARQCVNACAGINPEAVPDLVEAAKAGIVYDAAVMECANDPDKMASYCTVQGDRLDDLYDDWIAKTRAALANVEDKP